MILCDTDVIIEFYKETPRVIKNLRAIGEQNIAISIVTSGELLFGALNKRELNQISRDIETLNLIHVNKEIGERFHQLLIQYSLSHKLSLPDGLIAATCLVEDIPLYTHNLKDFKFITGLRLYQEKT
jgi:tRNA(fMet)-specific endonuclease VapC